MLEQIETIVMWAEYGGALFWHKGKGCCGDSRSVITDSGKVINLNGIRGLKEWYARFDDDKYPAYEWSPEEYIAWKKEGVKYAFAVRDILPGHIDLVYDYDDGDQCAFIPRKDKVTPSKPLLSDKRLISEATELVANVYGDKHRESLISCVRNLCSACKYEELLEPAHCLWDDEDNKLVVEWYLETMACEFSFEKETLEEEINATFAIKNGDKLDKDEQPFIVQTSCRARFRNAIEIDFSPFVNLLSWHMLDRGLK